MRTDQRRELARAVIAAEDRADALTYEAGRAWCAGRYADARALVLEAAALDRSAAAMRARWSR